MAKKKSWFTLVKRFFISDSQSNQDKKEKRKKWVFARLRMKRLASLAPPPPPPPPPQPPEPQAVVASSVLPEGKKQSHRAVTPQSPNGVQGIITEKPLVTVEEAQAEIENERNVLEELSAVRIQTAFRGYLARKALRALKGIVTLQAIIRGRAVRRQAVTTLKRLQSIINIQSQVCANRLQSTDQPEPYSDAGDCDGDGGDPMISFGNRIMLRMESYNQRRWDDSLMSKEEADASFVSKKEAAIKRERIKEYWHQHRRSAESERKEVSGRWRYWLEQWVDTQLTKSKELEDLDTKRGDEFGVKKLRLRTLQARSEAAFIDQSPRKQQHRRRPGRQCSLGGDGDGDENLFSGGDSSSPALASAAVPTYMAATESARAKARSVSSPRLRPESLDGFSPSRNKLSLVSSLASEVPVSGGGAVAGFQQRSPSLKGVRGPVKSTRKIKDLSFDSSDCSLSHWNQQPTAFR